MRPRKQILCVSPNEQDLSVLTFMLHTNGFKVLPACSLEDALYVFSNCGVDLVIGDLPADENIAMARKMKTMIGLVPIMLLGGALLMQTHGADAMIVKRNCSAAELLERIKVMITKKRGPRKGSHHRGHFEAKPPIGVTVEVEEVAAIA